MKTGEILVALVTTSQTEGLSVEEGTLLEGWMEALKELELSGTYAGILHIVNDGLADVVPVSYTHLLYTGQRNNR